MKLSVSDICRGSAKVFFNLSVEGVDPAYPVGFAAFTKAGAEVPAMVFSEGAPGPLAGPSQDREFIVALPLLRTAVRFVAYAFTPEGALAAQGEATIHPLGAQLGSYMNTVLDGAAVRAIRNCDQWKKRGRLAVEFKHCLPVKSTGYSQGIMVGTLYLPCAVSSDVPALRFFDESMAEVGSDFCLFPVKIEPALPGMDGPVQVASFSVRVPVSVRSLIAVAVEGGRMLPGFASIDREQMEAVVGRADYICKAAPGEPSYELLWRDMRPSDGELLEQSRMQFPSMPCFSIVVPLYETPLYLFREMLDSVQGQSYGRWQLVLVNASPQNSELAEAVSQAVASDHRITAITLEKNQGITLNTNAGIDAATGDFICFLDHDDMLAPDALYEYAKALNDNPQIDMLYSDEDLVTAEGAPVWPALKPDFSPDLLRNNNYITHFLAIRATLLRQLPQQGSEYDGAQDHNLTLMATEHTDCIHHVPRVLYHWRQAPGSTADNPTAKPYAHEAGKRAVQGHLDRLGIPAEVCDGPRPSIYRVKYHVQGNPLVSIIIPTCDQQPMLKCCLDSILQKSTYGNFEVVLVENNSTDPATFAYYEEICKADSRVRLCPWEGEGFNFSKLVNHGVAQAKGDYLLLLNNDTEVISPQWIEELLGNCQRDEVGAVGALLLYPDDTVQHAGVILGNSGASHAHLYEPYELVKSYDQCNYSAVTGACLMTKRSVFDEVGGFDEDFSVAYNDVDYCLRVRSVGKFVVFTPYVELYHYESVSRGYDRGADAARYERFLKEDALLMSRWTHYYAYGDPFFNPNLNRISPFVGYFHLRSIDTVS